MPTAIRLTTTLSTKGQVILPKSVRQHCDWGPGTKLEVEETADGVMLRRAPLFTPTDMESVFGVLKSNRPPMSIEEMDAAVAAEARRRAGD